ncbi:MAG: MFS transporter [Alphaproteobacteria bacterium]|nr:MFS transporter [Alphaproteobacteria bacterium]
MGRTQWTLFGTKRFLPLFITQFLGALNDNLFRQALIMLITFRLAAEVGTHPAVLNNLAIGLFILPYFLFSALAGQLADKFEKSRQIVWIKIWEIGLMVVGAFAFYTSSLPLLIAVLSGLGLQSTFFGPIKYGILPDLMKDDELLSANALVEAGTFIAILIGIIIGGLMVVQGENGGLMVSALMIGLAIIGTLSGRMVPKTGRAAPDLELDFNIFRATGQQLKSAWNSPIARPAIIGISWIWLYGSIYITQIPDIVKNRLGGDETVVTLIIAGFSIGIGVGSLLCSKILKGHVSANLAKPALLALAVVSLVFCLALPDTSAAAIAPENLLSLGAFLSHPVNWLIVTALIGVAITAGMVIVPLYAILQAHTPRAERSRMIAANNIFNSAFMAGGTIIAAGLIATGLSTAQILVLYALANGLILPAASSLKTRLATAD